MLYSLVCVTQGRARPCAECLFHALHAMIAHSEQTSHVWRRRKSPGLKGLNPHATETWGSPAREILFAELHEHADRDTEIISFDVTRQAIGLSVMLLPFCSACSKLSSKIWAAATGLRPVFLQRSGCDSGRLGTYTAQTVNVLE
jgi:hypothetical protein